MINEALITAALNPIFAGYPKTDDLIDLYDEVKTDVREHAQDLLDNHDAASAQEAVNIAVKELGNLAEPLRLITAAPESEIIATPNSQATVDQTFSPQAIHQIFLDADYGNVRITPSSDQHIHIRQFQRPKTDSGQLQIALVQDSIRLTVPAPSWLQYMIPFRHPTSLVEINLPSDFTGTLDVALKSGSLVARDLDNHTDVKLNLRSGSANLSRSSFATLNVRLTSGSIKTDQVSADQFTVDNHSGSIKMSNTTAQFDILAHSGSVKGTTLTGAGRFMAHSGSIKLHWTQMTGDIDLEAHSGSIKSELPLDEPFKFNLQAKSGTIKVNRQAIFDVQVIGAAIGKTDPSAQYEVKGRAHSGTIKID